MKPVTRSQFSLADQVRNRWSITVEPESTVEDLLKDEATQNIAFMLKVGDLVEASTADQAWFAVLLVKDCGRNFARFHVVQFTELVPSTPSGDETPSSAYEASWGGPHQKWRVIRNSDRSVLKDGLGSKAEAKEWIVAHEKAGA